MFELKGGAPSTDLDVAELGRGAVSRCAVRVCPGKASHETLKSVSIGLKNRL